MPEGFACVAWFRAFIDCGSRCGDRGSANGSRSRDGVCPWPAKASWRRAPRAPSAVCSARHHA